jgi:transcriptional regulator NrdR family protein
MKCPYCADKDFNSSKTKVIDSRNYFEPTKKRFFTERIRKCDSCEKTFKTVEYSPKVNHD